MKRLFWLALAVLFFFSGSPTDQVWGAYYMPDYYPLNVGRSWTYKVWEGLGSPPVTETETIIGKDWWDGYEWFVRQAGWRENYEMWDGEGLKIGKIVWLSGGSVYAEERNPYFFPVYDLMDLGDTKPGNYEAVVYEDGFEVVRFYVDYYLQLVGVQDVSLSTGISFADCLLLYDNEKQYDVPGGNLLRRSESYMLFAEGVGIVKDVSYEYDASDILIGVQIEELESYAVPVPGTALLLGSGLVGLVGFGRKRLGRK